MIPLYFLAACDTMRRVFLLEICGLAMADKRVLSGAKMLGVRLTLILGILLFGGLSPLAAQRDLSSAVNAGSYDGQFLFNDTQNTCDYGDNNANGIADILYRLEITNEMDITVSNCGSGLSDTYIEVFDSEGSFITDVYDLGGYGFCSDSYGQANLMISFLSPGTYYILSEGANDCGSITTAIIGTPLVNPVTVGDVMADPFDVGTQSDPFTYTDTENTADFNNDYGQPANDIYYSFTLTKNMTVVISHCGSDVGDTFLHLLDASGNELAYNDDYSGDRHCTNTSQSYIRQTLPAGTYYVVSEGFGNSNGNITTTIQGIASFGGLNASLGQNYIFTTTPTEAGMDASQMTTTQSLQTVQYFDGLGRPSQTVQRGITPQGADLVSGIEYDSFGRESRKWLPGAVAGNNGAYVPDFAAPAVQTNGDSSPFATTEYEPSPLNRVTGQYGPGADWYSNSKKKSIAYTTNAANSVKLYSVGTAQLSCTGYYEPATLYGQKTTDEDGKWMEEFTDKLGRKVLSRTYDVSGGNHDTYYVYDDLDNLRYVLPPLAADALGSGNYDNNADPLVKYAYLYTYDGRKRCIEKRLPGCDWIQMVYDRADRLILSQDGNQRAKNQWTVNKYDQFGRLLYSGIANNNSNRATMESNYATQIFTESYTGSGPVGGYTSDKITPDVLLTVNYYDNYDFLSIADNNPNGTLSSTAPDGYTAPDKEHTKTLLTGTRTYHLDDPAKFEVTALYYDKYGRTVQTRATNHLGGYDIACNEIDFTGKPLKTLKTHGRNGSAPEITELYTYSYDHAQRLLTTTHQLNGGATVTLASNTYDDLGRLKTKNLGGVDATTYNYNVRSWVKDITGSRFTENLYYNNAPGTITPFSPAYNGNIGAMKWSTPADGINRERIYTFGYDDLNRLKDGTYSELAGSTVVNSNRYTEQFDYDKMGNITNFVRYGLQGTAGGMAYGLIDDLTLTHQGNQLIKVTDNGNDGLYYGNEEFLQNTANSGNSAAYDANGNRLYDSNSNVWAIKYNTLNLPDAMQFYQGHQTNYTYSAAGAKLKVVDKTAPEGVTLPVSSLNTILSNPTVASTTTTDYDGNYIYENGSLKRILLPEGYWQNGAYFYYLKDHLGSNRIVVQNDGTVVESNSYYPSGMRFGESVVAANNSVQPYRHTGHEMQEMHGLNWIDNNARFRTVSYGGGFTGLDPLAEKYYSISPYVYCADNPVKFIDPTGMEFTENAWEQVNRLIDDINKRQAKNAANIGEKQAQISAGGLSEKQVAKLQKQIDRLNNNTLELEGTRGEIATLASSNQMYDIKSDNSMNINGAIPGTEEIRSGAAFNFNNGNFELALGDGSLGMLSHELKHAYQFETGAFSSGYRSDGVPFYDKTDEFEAYSRGSLFGGERIRTLPSLYDNLQNGPMDATKLAPIILRNPVELQKIADRTRSAFRVNGVTYIMQGGK